MLSWARLGELSSTDIRKAVLAGGNGRNLALFLDWQAYEVMPEFAFEAKQGGRPSLFLLKSRLAVTRMIGSHASEQQLAARQHQEAYEADPIDRARLS